MTESTDEQQSRYMFLQVSNDLMPADAQDSSARSDFLCHAVLVHFKQNFTFALNRCRSGEFGAEVQKAVEANADEFTLLEALKEAAATSILLVMREQGEDAQAWLIAYLTDALNKTDLHVYPTPGAQGLLDRRAQLSTDEILVDLNESICKLLGLATGTGPAEMFFGQIGSSREFCNELLLFSLTQPEENLTSHLALYGK